MSGANGTKLGNRDLEFRQQFEQVAFELLVGAVDLVDQEHGRLRAHRIDGLQQRPLDQERIAIELLSRRGPVDAAGGFEDLQLENLARVVPLVDGMSDVETLVALQSDQVGVEGRRHRRGERRLADAGLALEKERALQLEREEQRHGERAIGDVVLLGKAILQIGGGRRGHADSVSRELAGLRSCGLGVLRA